MSTPIERDTFRFRQIVKGQVRKELKKYMSKGEMIGKQGDDLVSIPVPQLDLPHFRFGREGQAGVGQGEGEVGAILSPGDQSGSGPGAGESPGEHLLEVELSIGELAEILGEELQLPRIAPKGKRNLQSARDRYSTVRRVGPESLRHFKRTYKQALKRQMLSGLYDPKNPRIIPIREDTIYRAGKTVFQTESSAVIIYMMDVSGSMADEQKEIVRIESFWIDAWLRSQYKSIESRYIIHDAVAREVDQHTFYHTRESGGTVISSAYNMAQHLIERHYPSDDWNIYLFHFSDGDNSFGDNQRGCELVSQLLPQANMFGYAQVTSRGGSGQFKHILETYFNGRAEAKYEDGKPRLVLSTVPNQEGIYQSIKDFLGKGN